MPITSRKWAAWRSSFRTTAACGLPSTSRRRDARSSRSAPSSSAWRKSSRTTLMLHIKQWFRNLSLARKLTTIGVATSTASVVVACVLVVAYDISSSRDRVGRDAGLLADVVGDNSTAALAFGDASGAGQTLSAVAVNPHVVAAAIILPDGTRFATYQRRGRAAATLPAVDAAVWREHRAWQAFTSDG